MTVATFQARASLDQDLILEARRIIKRALREYPGEALVAYSGGKDGNVAALLAQELGLNHGVCETSFTFLQQREDIRRTAQRYGHEVVYRSRLDLPWLKARPQHVFSRNTRLINALCQVRQRATMESYAKAHGYRLIITGRKRAGNSVKAPIYEKGGFVYVHPLANWKDLDIWAYLKHRGQDVPWIYHTPFGRREGNSAWPFYRESTDRMVCYRAIYDTEPAIVEEAAVADIIGARAFLDTL